MAKAILRANLLSCGFSERTGASGREYTLDDEIANSWEDWLPEARAALTAIREPSEGTLRAAFVAMNETPGGTWKRMKAENATPRRLFDVKMVPRWQAMIDHILGFHLPPKGKR